MPELPALPTPPQHHKSGRRGSPGTAELAEGIGLLTPWLAGLAAAGLAANMAGATIINATVLRDIPLYRGLWVMTGLLCVVFMLLAYGRRQQIKGLWAAIRR